MTSFTRQAVFGPLPEAQWQENSAVDSSGQEFTLLSTPDAGNETRVNEGLAPVFHTLLAHPAVAHDSNSAPRLSITFVLSHLPDSEQSVLAPLIQRAVFGVDVTLAPEPSLLSSITADDQEYRTLFPIEGAYRLLDGDAFGVLSEADLLNGQIGAALNMSFDRPGAIKLLDALNGMVSDFFIAANLTFRTAAHTSPSRFEIDLVQVHEFLTSVSLPDSVFYEIDFRNYLALMIARGIIKIEGPDLPVEPDLDKIATAVLPDFLRKSRLIIERVDSEESGDLGPGYILRPFSAESMGISISTTTSDETFETLVLSVTLDELLEEALHGRDLSSFVHIVAIDEDGRGVVPLPRRARSRKTRAGPLGNNITLAAGGGNAVALSHAVRPTSTIISSAHVLHSAQPQLGRIDHLAATNLTISLSQERRRHLPVIEQKKSGYWPDRIDRDKRYWYAPEFELIMPGSTSQPTDTPFLFSYRATGHDIAGKTSLEAEIRFLLRRVIPNKTKAELDQLGAIRTDPVNTNNLSFALEIPFMAGGGLKRESIQATDIQVNGDEITVTFKLLNDWVRLAYGALAFEGFQPGEPARISAAYTFEAYIPIKDKKLNLAAGGKSFHLPLVAESTAKGRLRDRTYITKENGTVHFPGGTLSVSGEERAARPLPQVERLSVATFERPVAVMTHTAVRPELFMAANIHNTLSRKQYAVSTQSWSAQVDALVPCNAFGSLYIEQKDDGPHVIGCQDHFKLGQTEYCLYEELLPKKPNYRVFRSLQTPGRFLIVPDSYVIGRYEPSEDEKAYRPLILLYSTIDIDDLQKSRCIFQATLQPDIPVWERRQLLDELRTDHHPDATLQFFTEIEGDLAIDWELPTTGPGGILSLEAGNTRFWDSFQVSLATDAFGVPQLQAIMETSGISAEARLALPDGTSLRTRLRLHLSHIAGPWIAGPLEVTTGDAGSVEVHNHLETTVNLSALLAGDEQSVTSVPVDTRLASGATERFQLDNLPSVVLPIYSLELTSASLGEIRNYIEDITIGLTVINSLKLEDLQLQQVEVKAKVKDGSGEASAVFTPESLKTKPLQFLLPLTTYLANPVIEFQAYGTDLAGQVSEIATWTWPIHTNGVLVELSSELINT